MRIFEQYNIVLLLYSFEENFILCLIEFIMLDEFFKLKSTFFVYLTIEFTFLSICKRYNKVCAYAEIYNLKDNNTVVTV